jgi:WD40 repeat protein
MPTRRKTDISDTTRMWAPASSAALATLKGHTAKINCLAFSPDGTRAATGSTDHTVRMWDAATGSVFTTLKGHQDDIRCLAFSPDGTRLATGSYDKTLRMWNVADGAVLATLRGHTGHVCCLAFSPDGTRLATGSADETVRLWDVVSGAVLATLDRHTYRINCLAFSPDGTRIVTGSDECTVRKWRVATGDHVAQYFVQSSITCVAFSPNGTRFAAGNKDGTVQMWDAASGEVLARLKGHKAKINCLAFSPDGRRLVTGSDDKTARMWEVPTFPVPSIGTVLAVLEGHTGVIHCVACSPDGTRLATGSKDNDTLVWDVDTGAVLTTLKGHTADVNCLAFSPDGKRLITGSDDKTARLWGVATGVVTTFKGLTDHVSCLAFSPDGTRLACGNGGVMLVRNVASGSVLATVTVDGDHVRCLAFSPDGKRLATGHYGTAARVWHGESGEALMTIEGHADGVRCLAFSADGTRLATGSDDKTARMWDIDTGAVMVMLEGHTDRITSLAFSPDGTRLATGSYDRTARIWNVATGAVLATFEGHTIVISCLAFSPDGTRIATGSWDSTVRMWSVATGAVLATLEGRDGGCITCLAFSPDGTRIATGSDQGSSRMWDVATGAILATLKGHAHDVSSLAFSPDGTRLATGNRRSTARLWDVARFCLREPSLAKTEKSSTAANREAPPSGDLLRALRAAVAADATTDARTVFERTVIGEVAGTRITFGDSPSALDDLHSRVSAAEAACDPIASLVDQWRCVESDLNRLARQEDPVRTRDEARRCLVAGVDELRQASLIASGDRGDRGAGGGVPATDEVPSDACPVYTPATASNRSDTTGAVNPYFTAFCNEVARRRAEATAAELAWHALCQAPLAGYGTTEPGEDPLSDGRVQAVVQRLLQARQRCSAESLSAFIALDLAVDTLAQISELERRCVEAESNLKRLRDELLTLQAQLSERCRVEVEPAVRSNRCGIEDSASAEAAVATVNELRKASVKAARALDRAKLDVPHSDDEATDVDIERARKVIDNALNEAQATRREFCAAYRRVAKVVPRFFPEHADAFAKAADIATTTGTITAAPYALTDFTIAKTAVVNISRAELRTADTDDLTVAALKEFACEVAFTREVQMMQTGAGAHVAPILFTFRDGHPLRFYLATPWYEGGALDTWVNELRTTSATCAQGSVAVVLRMLSQVARALQRLHDRGVAHCDVKSANIAVSGSIDGDAHDALAAAEGCEPHLIDFGIAVPKAGDTDLLYRTLTATMIGGTLAYMPPEVMTALTKKDISGLDFTRVDCYALGTVVKEMLEAVSCNVLDETSMTTLSGGPAPADGWTALATTLRTLTHQLLHADASRRPSMAHAADTLSALAAAARLVRCGVCDAKVDRTRAGWCEGSSAQHVYCVECLGTMVTSNWRTGVSAEEHDRRGSVYVTCTGYPGCCGRIHGEGLGRMRPEAQVAVQATKNDQLVRRAVANEGARLAAAGTIGLVESRVTALFTPKCPSCGRGGAFDFTECMSIICQCRKQYCGYCLAAGDAHRHINDQHRDVVASIATKHSRGCRGLSEPLWTCEPRWRAAWYRLHQLEKCIVPLYSLLDDVAQRRESWQRMMGDIAPFPHALE